MTLKLYGDGEITGATSIESPTILSGLTIPTTGFGKVLQIVRATDATFRTTSSTSFVDASNSVTITPQKTTSSILLIAIVATQSDSNNYVKIQITDNSNVAISGAERMDCGTTGGGIDLSVGTLIGYDSPNTTSATTYKLRFATGSAGTARISNNLSTGQMYAIEVSA